jgi:hypothetical protein
MIPTFCGQTYFLITFSKIRTFEIFDFYRLPTGIFVGQKRLTFEILPKNFGPEPNLQIEEF